MNYRSVFTGEHALLIVVHAENPGQTLRNVRIAHLAGADGVFLVNHKIDFAELVRCYTAVRQEYAAYWIGVNFLDLENCDAIRKAGDIRASGIWLDSTNIQEDADSPGAEAHNIQEWQKEYASQAVLFGSVAFKYQMPVRNPARVAGLATWYFDVVTTSGEGTGIAPDVRKIRAMKRACAQGRTRGTQ